MARRSPKTRAHRRTSRAERPHRREALTTIYPPTPLPGHIVICPYCALQFSVFASAWCAHAQEPSKICPRCGRCMCQHDVCQAQTFWKHVFLRYP